MKKNEEPKIKIAIEMTAERLLLFLKMLKRHDKELFELFKQKLNTLNHAK